MSRPFSNRKLQALGEGSLQASPGITPEGDFAHEATGHRIPKPTTPVVELEPVLLGPHPDAA